MLCHKKNHLLPQILALPIVAIFRHAWLTRYPDPKKTLTSSQFIVANEYVPRAKKVNVVSNPKGVSLSYSRLCV